MPIFRIDEPGTKPYELELVDEPIIIGRPGAVTSHACPITVSDKQPRLSPFLTHHPVISKIHCTLIPVDQEAHVWALVDGGWIADAAGSTQYHRSKNGIWCNDAGKMFRVHTQIDLRGERVVGVFLYDSCQITLIYLSPELAHRQGISPIEITGTFFLQPPVQLYDDTAWDIESAELELDDEYETCPPRSMVNRDKTKREPAAVAQSSERSISPRAQLIEDYMASSARGFDALAQSSRSIITVVAVLVFVASGFFTISWLVHYSSPSIWQFLPQQRDP